MLTLLHSEWAKLYGVLAILSAKGLTGSPIALRTAKVLAVQSAKRLNVALLMFPELYKAMTLLTVLVCMDMKWIL